MHTLNQQATSIGSFRSQCRRGIIRWILPGQTAKILTYRLFSFALQVLLPMTGGYILMQLNTVMVSSQSYMIATIAIELAV